jgi:hypothetical protein
VSALQSALERSQAAESTFTARLADLTSQLASSSLEGGSLRAHNGELLSELAALRWVRPCQGSNVGLCVGHRVCEMTGQGCGKHMLLGYEQCVSIMMSTRVCGLRTD